MSVPLALPNSGRALVKQNRCPLLKGNRQPQRSKPFSAAGRPADELVDSTEDDEATSEEEDSVPFIFAEKLGPDKYYREAQYQ
jgi:hypothetical protein